MAKENLREFKRRTLKSEEQLMDLKKDLTGIIEKIGKIENRFFELEEIKSSHFYPAGRKIKNCQEQIVRLQRYFPDLQFKAEVPVKLPESAEGWIVVPKPSKISSTYNEALEIILRMLLKERPSFLNGREGELGEDYLKIDTRTKKAMAILEKTTEGDYIVLPVQLGKKHLGRSSRRAKILFDQNEFGLGPLEVAVFLLTHPNWLTTEGDLGIDCVGGRIRTV